MAQHRPDRLLSFWSVLAFILGELIEAAFKMKTLLQPRHSICPVSPHVWPDTCTISWQPIGRCNGRKAG